MKSNRVMLGLACLGALVCRAETGFSQRAPGGVQDGLFVTGALETPGARHNLACRAAMRYSELIHERRYDAVGGLFADNASYSGPNDDPIKGAKAIGDFYKVFLSNAKPQTKIATLVPAGAHDCYMELLGTSNGYTMPAPGALDRFTVDGTGKVTNLTIFFRPKSAQALASAAAPALSK